MGGTGRLASTGRLAGDPEKEFRRTADKLDKTLNNIEDAIDMKKQIVDSMSRGNDYSDTSLGIDRQNSTGRRTGASSKAGLEPLSEQG
ncbi:unnamed protein product, partial [Heterosigma akashiwo]